MKVFRQIEIDDKQRHRESENAVGQSIEPAFRNKLLGFNHHPFPVFQSNLRRYVSWRGNPEQSDACSRAGTSGSSPVCSRRAKSSAAPLMIRVGGDTPATTMR